jgi:teichuronic acid biosynthesis glycosyltransferase TuaC
LARILVITKRQYTNKDLIDDQFGRLREIPWVISRRGHKVKGICLSYAGKREGIFKDDRVLWHSCNATTFKIPGLLKFIRKADQLAQQADVIWAGSDSIYGIIGYFIAKRHHIPLIFDLYDNFEYFLLARLPIIKQLYHWTLRHCAAVTCVSQPLAQKVASIRSAPKVVVLENGVRADLFKPMDKNRCRKELGLPQEGILIGTTGAIHRNRGINTLLEAFFLLKRRIFSLKLVLAGAKDKSIQIPNHDAIHYLGQLPLITIPKVINSLDIAIVCNQNNEFSRYCFPQKAQEIIACDVPLIAADIGCMRDLLQNYPRNLFTPDDPKDLADCIYNRLKSNQPENLAVITWSQLAVKLEDLMLELTKK